MQAQTKQQTGVKKPSQQQQVQNLLHWDELRYCHFKYRQGIQYLRLYTQGDDGMLNWLERNRLFWNWWKIQWALRDSVYAEDAGRLGQLQHRRLLYTSLHNPYTLIHEIVPPVDVFGDLKRLLTTT